MKRMDASLGFLLLEEREETVFFEVFCFFEPHLASLAITDWTDYTDGGYRKFDWGRIILLYFVELFLYF